MYLIYCSFQFWLDFDLLKLVMKNCNSFIFFYLNSVPGLEPLNFVMHTGNIPSNCLLRVEKRFLVFMKTKVMLMTKL